MQATAALFAFLLGITFVCAGSWAPLLQEDSPERIPDEYIIVLRGCMSEQEIKVHMKQLEQSFGLNVNKDNALLQGPFVIGDFKGFAVRLTDELLARERSHPNVSYIEANQRVSLFQGNDDTCEVQKEAEWNLNRISERVLDYNGLYHYYGTAGADVNVYIIDTGIYIDNVEFEGRASWGFAMDKRFVDGNGHGTHVAGTVGGKLYGVAKKSSLIAVKVLSASGSGTYADVIAGVNYVTNAHTEGTRPSVANMSLGGPKSPALVAAVENSIAAGVTYAIAAGNSNANACNGSPADAPNAVVVGSSTKTDQRSPFSNFGPCVDIFAPGSDIKSAWIGSPTAVKTISGTSMAAPHIAGAAALILAKNPDISPDKVSTELTNSCTKDTIVNPGTGSPNCFLFASCEKKL